MDSDQSDSTMTLPPETREKRILVVDDSRTVLKILAKGLRSLGYEVLTAEDGLEAKEILEDVVFDLVLTDLNMPRVDGFELIEHVRSRSAWQDLPIIVLTSKGDKESMRRALDAGANIYLNKPAPLPKLRYKVQSLLGDVADMPSFDNKVQESPEISNAIDAAEREGRRAKRLHQLSPEMHVEMYLMTATVDEAHELLEDFRHRDDVDAGVILPMMLDTSLSEDELLRLYELIGKIGNPDFAVPLLRRFQDHSSAKVKRAMVLAIADCGHKEFLPDLAELWHEEMSTTVNLDEDQKALLDAFEESVARLQQTETRIRSRNFMR